MNRKGSINSAKIFRVLGCILLVTALHGPSGLGSPENGWAQPGDATDEGLEITGLILDETKTKAGRDFFEWFNSYWREVKGLQYTITIQEIPDATRGTFMFIKVNDTMVYRQRMNPNPAIIENAAKSAVNRVRYYLFRQLNVQKNLEEEFQF